MEFQQVLNNRRSIRQYQDREVDPSLILELLEAARISPSAKNRQPWRFLIASKEQKEAIAKELLHFYERIEDPKERAKKASIKATASSISQAPCLIVVGRQISSGSTENDLLSIGSAVEHICLKATDLGLGSLWICHTTNIRQQVEAICQLQGISFVCVIAIGYPEEDPAPRPRKSLEEIIIEK